jgi:endonuclease YncB( thermonuclease family)
MQRAFVTQGTWETPDAPPHDAKAHKRVTLRVSALVGAAVLASAMLPGLELSETISAPKPLLRTEPEIVKVVLKEIERVPAFGDITSTATLRRANPVSLDNLPRSRMAPTEPAREAEALEPHTIRHEGRVLRLSGIEPPPPAQMCRRLDGMQVSCIDRALSYMNLLIKGRRLQCDDAPAFRPEADGPPQASCRVGDADVAEAMVRQGWAKAGLSHAGDQPEERFLLAQSAARKQKLGLWQ